MEEKQKQKQKQKQKCEHCDKILSSKRNLNVHLLTCVYRKENELIEKDRELKELKELKEHNYRELIEKDRELKEHNDKELSEKDKELSEKDKELIEVHVKLENYKEQLEKQEEQIKYLQDKLDKIANKAIDRPTSITNTTNNNLNITSSIDFNNLETIKEAIENNLNANHVVDGQRGIVQFLFESFLKDDDGNLKYKCTD